MTTGKALTQEPMTVVDTAWLRMDSPQNLMVINGAFLFDMPMTRDRLAALLTERFLKNRRFRTRPVLNGHRYVWQEVPELDMDYHVTSVALPAAETPERALQQLASELICETLDPAKPLWRFYHIDQFNDGCAVFFKVHHSYADGIALITVLDSIADESVLYSSPAANFKFPERSPMPPDMTGRLGYHLSSLLMSLGFGMAWLYEATKVLVLPADSKTAYKRPLCTEKHVAWAPSLPVDEVKRVAKAMNCTINDVLLGCVAGSLRRYLQGRGEPVDGIRLRATVPVNLRPLEKASDLGNAFGLVYLDLPVGIQDPAMRVRRVRRSMASLKNGMQAKMSYGVLSILGHFPPQWQRLALNFFSRKASAVMTNVPGPSKPVYLGGVKLSKPMFWVPQSGDIGLGISILSYDGKVEFGLIADSALIPEPQDVVDDFVAEYSQLRNGLLGASAASSQPATA